MDTLSSMSTSSEGDSIKIFLRVRPPDPSISENDFAPRVLDVNTADNAVILRTKPEPKIFTYDNVADADITQEAVFSIVGKKIIESCVAGYNGTIFAYGQTGSGKTFTMLGPSENSESFQHELRGVIPRSFEYLFSLIAHQQELHGSKKQFLCRCSFLEIYQEQIFDLLDPASQGLHLRENMNKGVFVDGLIEQVICHPSDAYQVLIMGWLNRRVAATSMNRESSRSHAVFTVTIESKEDVGGVQNIRTSQLNLVDLAGSERQRDTNTGGTRLKEAGSINKSLSVLGNVIMSLVDLSHGKKRHIPYRDSKLTFLLRDSLGGNTKTRMIACVHPDSRCFGETLSTLNFARSAKLIKNKAVVNEDFRGNNQKLQNEIRRLKELLETLQNSPSSEPPVATSTCVDSQTLMSTDSVWKKNFVEAMYFREQSENEKKALQDVVNHLQELCNKKDKYIQSTKMIIKFRENHIQTLQKAAGQSYIDMEKDTLVKSLRDEIKVLRQQLENNPWLAKYAGENKHLRSELKQLRARESLGNVHCDSSRIDELERVFKELKLYKELSTGSSCGGLRGSPLKDGLSAATLEKHRREIKGYQEQIENAKQQMTDFKKAADNRQMEMEVELVSCRKMITELERVLEAHQLKARIECNALKDLHCQTLKVMTTPKLSGNSPNTHDQSVGDLETEQGITDCILPKDLAEGAHDALMEEIRTLQMENGKLKERIDEYEADLLRQRQQVEKLELYNTQLSGVLDKERTENTARRADYTSAVNTLKEEIDTVKNDLKLLNDENTDLHLVLKSADKQLKEEKEKQKAAHHMYTQELQSIETKLSKANIDLETTTRDYEEALKELGALKEELETAQVTISFLENHAFELEESRNQEMKKMQKMEQEYKALKTSSGELDSYKEYTEKAKADMDMKDAELEAALTQKYEQEKKVEHQERIIEENKEMISTLMNKMQEMKMTLSGCEASNMALKSEVENYKQELEDIKKEQESTASELAATKQDLSTTRENYETHLQRKEFEINNLQEDQESLNSSLYRQMENVNSLQEKLDAKERLCKELQACAEDYKQKLLDCEKAMQEASHRYEERLREVSSAEESADGIRKRLQQKNLELESLHQAHKKLNGMLLEYEQTRKEKNEENEHLKLQVAELERMREQLQRSRQEVEDLQVALTSAKSSNSDTIKSLESSVREKDQELKQEQSSLKSLQTKLAQVEGQNQSIKELLRSSEMEKEHYQCEVERLQSRLETQYMEKMELSSKVESLQEEKTKLSNELHTQKELNTQLVEESNRLVGHSNTNQKIRLFDKKNQEYNELNKKYLELQAEYRKVAQESVKAQPKLSVIPVSKTVGALGGIRDITNVTNSTE